MTQDERNLLMKDLGARLPHHVKVRYSSTKQFFVCNLHAMNPSYTVVDLWSKDGCFTSVHIDKIKPYLFPMASMTEEQALELYKLFGIKLTDSIGWDYIKINEVTGITFFLRKGFDVETHLDKLIDWLLKNNFDFRGLIPMGLALDATGLNIY